MTISTVDRIEPQHIVDAFGNYLIGITLASKGDGHLDDGRFRDIITSWQQDTIPVLKAAYVRHLVRECRRGSFNFIEFWGWPEIRYRDDDNHGMVYSRVRFMHVVAEMNNAGRMH